MPALKKIRAIKNNLKRKFSDLSDKIQKKKKVLPSKLHNRRKSTTNFWITGNSVRNYLIRDPLCDWFDYHYNKLSEIDPDFEVKKFASLDSNKISNNTTLSYTELLLQQGKEFETQLVPHIVARCGSKHFLNIGGNDSIINKDLYEKTMKAMKKGVPFIYAGVLWDEEEYIRGIPDLIVRSDYLNGLVDTEVISAEEACIQAPLFTGNAKYHYRIVDIKMHTMHLRSNGKHLTSSGSVRAFKGQLYIYNKILSKMQKYDPQKAYILGKGYSYECKHEKFENRYAFDRLGEVDFFGVDEEFVAETEDAINWQRENQSVGDTWNPLDVGNMRQELYPNMSNRNDYPWHDVKKKLAEKIGEISSLWMCGPAQRKAAHARGIYNWQNKKCTAETLDVTGERTAPILNEILKINHQKKIKVSPELIENNDCDWQTRPRLEMYVDFETVHEMMSDFSNLPYSETNKMIYMIGVGYCTYPNNEAKWHYRRFVANQLTLKEEYRICKEFGRFVHDKIKETKEQHPLLVHWCAEKKEWEEAAERHKMKGSFWGQIDDYWFDLYNVFRKEPIVVKGSLTFGLKDVAKALYDQKLIDQVWDDTNPCSNGLTAMIIAVKAYEEAKKREIPLASIPTIVNVIKYNEIDCKVLFEIIEYLREHHTK